MHCLSVTEDDALLSKGPDLRYQPYSPPSANNLLSPSFLRPFVEPLLREEKTEEKFEPLSNTSLLSLINKGPEANISSYYASLNHSDESGSSGPLITTEIEDHEAKEKGDALLSQEAEENIQGNDIREATSNPLFYGL